VDFRVVVGKMDFGSVDRNYDFRVDDDSMLIKWILGR
jgi:hypothetical protein